MSTSADVDSGILRPRPRKPQHSQVSALTPDDDKLHLGSLDHLQGTGATTSGMTR